ncbi:dihydrofolate reductase family protein [Devosia neptuniae]|uniref:Dihydrofolate reductase family protein n=1 Tax=Devosia neptuniae TaxID=191302 RepID=A0ABY6CFT8_9HYPH|nr:dihydrofolate reductase family protein [Devosia neptuniae]UXN71103.1 dihydrofolate reductase family protein [Devosia neptuniae]
MAQQVRAHMSLSLDGFGTGLNQSREKPFGDIKGEPMHRWMFEDAENNRAELDAITEYGAFIMGRNMFAAPGADVWEIEWKGWWGPNPPYHAPVFVLTHYARPPIEMEGGTVFYFVTEGPEVALDRAREAAGSRHVAIAGGVTTLRNYLNMGAIDTLHLQIAPVVLGRGERLWDGLTATLEPIGARATRLTTHMDYRVAKS